MTTRTRAHWNIERNSGGRWSVWHSFVLYKDHDNTLKHRSHDFPTFEEAAAASERWYLTECAEYVRENEATTTERSTTT